MSSSSPLQRKFIKPSSISEYLKCPICLDVFQNSLRLFCGHTFCEGCLQDYMKNGNVCPECRTPIQKKNIGIDLLARQIINQLEVFCTVQECPWKGVLGELEQHVGRECVFGGRDGAGGGRNCRKNQKIVWHQTLDDEVIDKINQNTVKGSLQTRILIKTDSLKQHLPKMLKSETLSNTQPKQKKAAPKRNKKLCQNSAIKEQHQSVKKGQQKSSNFDFLSSLFQ